MKERRARDLLPEITKICMFKCNKSNCTTMRHVHNESAKFLWRYIVQFDINGPSNLIETASNLWEIMVPFPARIQSHIMTEICPQPNIRASTSQNIYLQILMHQAYATCVWCKVMLIISAFPSKHNRNGTDSDHLCKHLTQVKFWSIKAYIIFTFDFLIAGWYAYSRKLFVDKLTTQVWCEVCSSGHVS